VIEKERDRLQELHGGWGRCTVDAAAADARPPIFGPSPPPADVDAAELNAEAAALRPASSAAARSLRDSRAETDIPAARPAAVVEPTSTLTHPPAAPNSTLEPTSVATDSQRPARPAGSPRSRSSVPGRVTRRVLGTIDRSVDPGVIILHSIYRIFRYAGSSKTVIC